MITVNETVNDINVTEENTLINVSPQTSVITIQDGGETIQLVEEKPVIQLSNETSVIQVHDAKPVITITSSGAQGPPGPPGSNDKIQNLYTAAENIGGHRVVRTDDNGQILTADSTDLNSCGRVTGITVNSVSSGQQVQVISQGIIEDQSFSYTPGNSLFYNFEGVIVETPPTTGFFQLIGRVETSTRIYIDLEEPIKL